MEGPKEKMEDAVQTVEQGDSEVTPFAALGGVTVVVLGVAGILAAILVVVWLVLL